MTKLFPPLICDMKSAAREHEPGQYENGNIGPECDWLLLPDDPLDGSAISAGIGRSSCDDHLDDCLEVEEQNEQSAHADGQLQCRVHFSSSMLSTGSSCHPTNLHCEF